MKISTSVKKICKFCKIIKRKKTIRIICSLNLKHNQRQG